MSENDKYEFITHMANTPSCWEIHGEFSVFPRGGPAKLEELFKNFPGASKNGSASITVASVRIKQAFKQPCLQFFASGSASPVRVPHGLIRMITSAETVEWIGF